MSKKLTTEEFIQKAKNIHGTKYDYSMVQYCGAHTKVKIICPVHGEFEQKPNGHLCGKGCLKCSGKDTKNTEEFIREAKAIHGDRYDYSMSKYKSRNEPIQIGCPKHGIIEVIPYNHIKGSHCGKCSGKSKHTTESFIEKSRNIFGDQYDYSKVDYINKSTKVIIICPIHGEFEQTPNNHFNSKIGCNLCKLISTESKPIKDIEECIKNFEYIKEQRFNDCRNSYPLPFDFYLEKFNLCIEYDGIHHFKPIEFWGGDDAFLKTQKNDNIKNQFCKENNINLLRIRYDEDHVSVLKEYFKNNFNIEL